jgi:hypothetical protein
LEVDISEVDILEVGISELDISEVGISEVDISEVGIFGSGHRDAKLKLFVKRRALPFLHSAIATSPMPFGKKVSHPISIEKNTKKWTFRKTNRTF